jgi:hypothetical protein
MNNKEKYYQAMKTDNGRLDEIQLGETLGFDEAVTRKIISILLSEYKIEFVANGSCGYRVTK